MRDLKNQITNYLDYSGNEVLSSGAIENSFDGISKTLPLDEQEIVKKFIKSQISRRKNRVFQNSEKYRNSQNTSPYVPSPSFEEMEKADNQPGLEDTNHMNTSKKNEHSEVLPQKEIVDAQPETISEDNSEPSMENPAQKHFQEIEKVDDTPAFTKEDLKSGSKIFWVIGPDDLDLDKLPNIPQEPIMFNEDEKKILENYRQNLSTGIDELMGRRKYLKGLSFDKIQQESTQKIFYRFTTDSIKKIHSFLDELKNKVTNKIQIIQQTTTSAYSAGGTKKILLNNWQDFLKKIDTLKETVQKSHQKLVKYFAEHKYPLKFKEWTDTKVTHSKKHPSPLGSVNQSAEPGILKKKAFTKVIKKS